MSMKNLFETLFSLRYEKVEPSLLGEGTYGKVFKARSIRSGELVAMKQMKIEGTELRFSNVFKDFHTRFKDFRWVFMVFHPFFMHFR